MGGTFPKHAVLSFVRRVNHEPQRASEQHFSVVECCTSFAVSDSPHRGDDSRQAWVLTLTDYEDGLWPVS